MPHPIKGYFNAAGKRVPGTTTIINRFKDSSALLWWANAEGLEGRRLYEKRDAAAEIGTIAHSLVESYINWDGRHYSQTEILEKAKLTADQEKLAWNAFDQFITWVDQTKIEFETKYQEVQLVSEIYQFGGTPDAIGKIGGKRILLDWKTSSGIFPDYLVQTAAYVNLWNENYPESPVDGGVHIARFSKEYADYEHRYFGEIDQGWELFKLYRAAYEIDKEVKKRVR